MDDASAGFIFIVFYLLVSIVIAAFITDWRFFDEIQRQCEQQGYVQNRTVRLHCSVEKRAVEQK